jgi:hypothetical protein
MFVSMFSIAPEKRYLQVFTRQSPVGRTYRAAFGWEEAGALRRRRRYSPLMITAAGYSAGTVFVLFSAMYYVHSPGSWQLSRSSLYVVAYAVLCVSCLRYSHYVQTPQTPPPRLR